MGVKCSVELATTKTVEKTVEDGTVEGYEVAYSGYFNAAEAPEGDSEGPDPEAVVTRGVDSLDDPKSCTTD